MANYYLEHTGAQLDEAIRKVLSGELDVPLQEKTVTPTTVQQTVIPDSSYKGLSKVVVNAIPQSYTDGVYNNGYNAGYNAAKPYKQELSYIESSGTQYINTLLQAKSTITAKFKIQMVGDGADNMFHEVYGGSSNHLTYWYAYQNKVYVRNGNAYVIPTSADNAVHEVETTRNSIIIDGVSYSWDGGASANLYHYLFCQNGNGNAAYLGEYRCFYAQFYDNGVLVRDFIPVLDMDGIPCLYDKVGRKLYYNSGTGTFTYA